VFIVNNTLSHQGLDGVWGLEGGDKGLRRASSNAWQHPGGDVNPFTNPDGLMFVNGAATNVAPVGTAHVLAATKGSAHQGTYGATSLGEYFNHPTHGSRAWNGDLGEVILFDRVLNAAERQVVENYLSARFAIPMAANDHYAGDTPGNGDYDLDVFGIGRTDSANQLEALAGSGGLALFEDNDTLGDGEWLLAGHNSPTNSFIEVGEGAAFERMERVWYVDKTSVDGLDAIFRFDLSDAGLAPGTSVSKFIQLIYSPHNAFEFQGLDLDPTLIGDQVYFAVPDAQLQDGYYTLGYTPEPGTLTLLGMSLLGLATRRRRRRSRGPGGFGASPPLLALLGFGLLTAAMPRADAALVGYWDFEDGTGSSTLTDISAGGHHGALVNMDSSTDWVTGAAGFGTALDFDGGNDYVSLGSASRAGLAAKSATVSYWANADTLKYQIPAAKHPGGGSGQGWVGKHRNNGDLWWRIGSQGNHNPDFIISSAYGTGAWQHYALSYDQGTSTAKVYINGVLRGVQPGIAQGVNDKTTEMRIGRGTAIGEHFDGKIDEVALFNTALSDGGVSVGSAAAAGSEVHQLYNSGAASFNAPQSVVQASAPDPAHANLALWLDANDAATVTTNLSGVVTQWRDKSWHGLNANLATGSPIVQPKALWDKSALSFDASENYFNLDGEIVLTPGEGGTVFTVYKTAQPNTNAAAIGHSSNYQILRTDGGGRVRLFANAFPHPVTNAKQAINAYGIRTMDFLGTTAHIYWDGPAQSLNTNSIAGNGFRINRVARTAFGPWHGEIAELLVYNTQLSAAERQAVNDYLVSKYVPITNLPADTFAHVVQRGNKQHYYALVTGPGAAMSWADAHAAVQDMEFTLPGYDIKHLATITSQDEYDFLLQAFGTFPDLQVLLGATDNPALTPGASDGVFTWITGEPFTFFNWATGNPSNDSGGANDAISLLYDGLWNDVNASGSHYFLVEFYTPEPGTLSLLAFGLLGLRARRRRKS
jgi:hypothetical protein